MAESVCDQEEEKFGGPPPARAESLPADNSALHHQGGGRDEAMEKVAVGGQRGRNGGAAELCSSYRREGILVRVFDWMAQFDAEKPNPAHVKRPHTHSRVHHVGLTPVLHWVSKSLV